MKSVIRISQQGNGDFETIQSAINSIPQDSSQTILMTIESGVYKEKLEINKPNLYLLGDGHVRIVYDDYAKRENAVGMPMGTFASSSTYISCDNIKIENITFENTAGESDQVSQAVALYVDADKVAFKNCSFLGAQDTLYLGRPKEELNNKSGRNYFENCRIVGDIDFIFGSATAYFQECQIVSKDQGKEINGYITAAATPVDKEVGFVFHQCKLLSDAAKNSVYLGRPWRDYARTVFIDCWMDQHIHQEGWNDWDKTSVETTVYYGEFGSAGPGANVSKRTVWSAQLNEEELKKFSLNECFRGDISWIYEWE
ncbi:pectinesterase [Paenibacillus anaericanus]|uniref:pectinesterase family protein n=1 Tax=Paenibacillus anaericanus TaxID=170367 RepID=UPI0027892341|nr:pectinesterase family protein [Paenibacillus anaericanus]MDQ0086948.1 pectinesterase [Paenibacillus anaericanus]